MGKFIDLSNKKFGRLTVIKFAFRKKSHYYWLCKCSCGNIVNVARTSLRKGETKSCGCISNELRIKHGMFGTRFYNIYHCMKRRCLEKNNKNYKYYGGRGITVCKQWMKFENFRDDMHLSYKEHCNKYNEKNTSIDRINNSKGYYKKNCRWATQKEQSNNTRFNHFLTYKNQTLTIAQWAKEKSIKYHILYFRINRGWSVEKAITTPANNYNFKEQ